MRLVGLVHPINPLMEEALGTAWRIVLLVSLSLALLIMAESELYLMLPLQTTPAKQPYGHESTLLFFTDRDSIPHSLLLEGNSCNPQPRERVSMHYDIVCVFHKNSTTKTHMH